MPSLHLPHGTIRKCQKRSTSSSRVAWQKTPKTASRIATNSLPLFIRWRVRVPHPQRPRPGSLFGCRSRSDSATLDTAAACCFSLHLFRSIVPSALASKFPLLRNPFHLPGVPYEAFTHTFQTVTEAPQPDAAVNLLGKWRKRARTGTCASGEACCRSGEATQRFARLSGSSSPNLIASPSPASESAARAAPAPRSRSKLLRRSRRHVGHLCGARITFHHKPW